MKKVLIMPLAVLLALFCVSCAGTAQETAVPAATPSPEVVAEAAPSPAAEQPTWESYYQRGLAYWAEDKGEEAIKCFESALEIDLTHPEIWLAYARVIRDDPGGYMNTLKAGLENTGDTATFQPMIDEALTEEELKLDAAIQWVDPEVERLVREYLHKPSGDIMRSELDSIESAAIVANMPLIVNVMIGDAVDWEKTKDGEVYYPAGSNTAYDQRSEIKTLEDFTNFRNISTLDVVYSELSDLGGLKNLKNLWNFSVGYAPVSDLSPAEGLYHIENLSAYFCEITDLQPLSNLITMRYLTLAGNKIADLSPLSGLVRLEVLDLRDNQVENLEALAEISNLQELYLPENPLSDLSPIGSLQSLTRLSVNSAGAADLSGISGLKNLQVLEALDNGIEDLAPLSGLTGLQELNLNGNQITDLRPLMKLTGLAQLYLAGNPIGDLTPLLALKNLQCLEVLGVSCSTVLLRYIPELYQ